MTVIVKSKKSGEGIVNGFSAFGFFFFCYLNLALFSPSNIVETHPKELMACLGLCFAREVAYLQIAHLQEDEYNPLNWPNFLILTLLIVNNSLHAWGFPFVSEYEFLITMTVFAFVSYLHWVYFGIQEITEELKIPVFSSQRNKYSGKNEKELA